MSLQGLAEPRKHPPEGLKLCPNHERPTQPGPNPAHPTTVYIGLPMSTLHGKLLHQAKAAKAIECHLDGHMTWRSGIPQLWMGCWVQVPAQPGWRLVGVKSNALIMSGGLLQIDFARVLFIVYFLALEELDLTSCKPLGQKLSRCGLFLIVSTPSSHKIGIWMNLVSLG